MNYLLALLKLISDMHFQRTVVASSFGCSLNEGVRLYCELQSLPIVGVSSRINQILLQRSPFVDLSVVFRPSPKHLLRSRANIAAAYNANVGKVLPRVTKAALLKAQISTWDRGYCRDCAQPNV